MKPRDWWLSVGAVVVALLVVAAAIGARSFLPRYDFRVGQTYAVRIDRWSGEFSILRNGAWTRIDRKTVEQYRVEDLDGDELAKFLREHPAKP